MDLLSFDLKKGNTNKTQVKVILTREELVEELGTDEIEANLIGGLVQVLDSNVARVLYNLAGIGQYLDDVRDEISQVNFNCFASEPISSEEIGKEWAEMTPVLCNFVLSPIEAGFLIFEWRILRIRAKGELVAIEDCWSRLSNLYCKSGEGFLKTYASYKHLKSRGWIVRNGIMFGCQFLIYCLGTKHYHSSAGVLISDHIDARRLISLTRILAHNKKSLIMISCESPANVNGCNVGDVDLVEIRVATAKTCFLDREAARMTTKRNEIYKIEEKMEL